MSPQLLGKRLLAAAGLALVAAATLADDRDLLRTGAANPMVFILLDTSGSMNWRLGDSMPSLRGDAPDSKLYQSKESLYAVVSTIDDISFGFGTFNQDDLTIRNKHWLYTAGSGTTPINVPGFGTFPPPGSEEVFGRPLSVVAGASQCDPNNSEPNNDSQIRNADRGCWPISPARTDQPWEMRRIQMVPKLGDPAGSSTTTTVYFQTVSNGCTWRVDYTRNPAGAPNLVGNPVVTVNVRVRLESGSCNSFDEIEQIPYTLVQEFVSWDFTPQPGPSEGFFGQSSTGGSDIFIDAGQNSTCKGWDSNTDSISDDTVGSYSHRMPLFVPSPNPPPAASDLIDNNANSFMDYGDIIPIDWRPGRSNRDLVLRRLAPNLLEIPAPLTPDFRVSPYLENAPDPNPGNLKGKPILGRPASDDNRYRPIVGSGATPLGNSIKDFRFFHDDWRDLASANDVDWSCRNVYLLILTDGNETCNSDAQGQTTALLNQGVKTYVIGFGVPETEGGDTLDDIANRGGTGKPFRPESPEDLVDALLDIFQRIREETRAFASAAVPSVQAEVSDKIYLTSFTPLRGESVWIGHADTYLKPLPLTDDGKPDRAKACPGGPNDSACFVWDSAVQLLGQAPDATQFATDHKLGSAVNERRVLYPVGATRRAGPGDPQGLRLFDFPTTPADKWDLWEGMQIPFVPGDTASESAAQTQAEDVIEFTLTKRTSVVDSPEVSGEVLPANCTRIDSRKISCVHLMGDVFHADPVVASNPNNVTYFAGNTDGYRDFFVRNRFRRKMLLTASNDGQLHAYDAGIFEEAGNSPQGNEIVGRFNNGTGNELFSFIPRLALPDLRLLSEIDKHRFAVDGTPHIDDVFIDPEHNGLPTAAQREWRTVVIGGMREGGSERGILAATYGYYALDVTEPDPLAEVRNGAGVVIGHVPDAPSYVPGCIAASPDISPDGNCSRGFPSLLWEFTDTGDEDLNGRPDLGETWSKPNTGRVRVQDDEGNVSIKYVAVFGGGMDPLDLHDSGNFLYMVDIETGKVLYKRALEGSAPSEPAAIDTDQDGLLDGVYIGTTLGFLYKVDLRPVPEVDALGRIPPTSTVWQPFKVFDTGGRPIFYPPSVVFVTQLARFALAFGVGNRENLWERNEEPGRFYLFVDDNWDATTPGLPRTEASYQAVGPDELVANPGARDFLQTAPFGWYLTLDPDERVITSAFSLAGITVFTSFRPVVCIDLDADGICDDVDPDICVDMDDDGICDDEDTCIDVDQDGECDIDRNPPGNEPPAEKLCARSGDSRIFVIFTTSGDPVIRLAGQKTRYWELGGSFVTEPYTEQSATKNPPAGSGKHADQLTPELEEIRQTLQRLFPPGYRFAHFRIDIKTIRSDTGVFFIAPVPVGMLEANWKEF